MDTFTAAADFVSKNPLLVPLLVLLLFSYVIYFSGKSISANFSSAMAMAGSQSVELNKRSEQMIALAGEKGVLLSENTRLRSQNDTLSLDIEMLKSEVKRLKSDSENLNFLRLQYEELTARMNILQARHDDLQRELDSEKLKNVELQRKLNEVQTELDTLRSAAQSPEPLPERPKSEFKDDIL